MYPLKATGCIVRKKYSKRKTKISTNSKGYCVMTQNKDGLWVLGYGSLIYKPPPHYTQRIPALIYGYIRRFWQSSIDHRGIPEAPGRVVTLIPYDDVMNDPKYRTDVEKYYQNHNRELKHDDLTTLGVAYYIPPEYSDEVRQYLDIREQNGYTLHTFSVHLYPNESQREELAESLSHLEKDPVTGCQILQTSVYIGITDSSSNEAFVGPEDIEDTAVVIAKAVGPSGSNYLYLKMLYDSLAAMYKDGEFVGDNSYRKDMYLDVLMDKVEKLLNK